MVTESVSFQGTGGRGPNEIPSTIRIVTFYIL